jgi:hypothetical protein
MPHQNIPRRRERIIVAAAALEFARLWIKHVFPDAPGPAAVAEDTYITRAIWFGHLSGQPLNLRALVDYTGIPRMTLVSALERMEGRGLVARNKGGCYVISAEAVQRAVQADTLDRVIDLILRTADALRKEQLRAPR